MPGAPQFRPERIRPVARRVRLLFLRALFLHFRRPLALHRLLLLLRVLVGVYQLLDVLGLELLELFDSGFERRHRPGGDFRDLRLRALPTAVPLLENALQLFSRRTRRSAILLVEGLDPRAGFDEVLVAELRAQVEQRLVLKVGGIAPVYLLSSRHLGSLGASDCVTEL